ncbi:MFS transporter [Kutzneria albida]|uniref:Transmembrane transporter n=1 Tax=Kutzneria albida DSM 43870 TaxID=1449976 RepID=W5WAZ2_9PSEU|nr:MFS transporter [Kutzneria albida]AHH95389.1 transmembrane transporter [Kutzneria albida DSM 43870]
MGAPALSRPDTDHRRGMVMWVLGASVYLVAVFHRTSLSVVSGLAEQRFGIGPAELSMFTVQQLLVAAGLQLPAGLLVDRFGPRRTLTAALVLMAVGQTGFALIADFPLGLVARALLGFGDALTFVSVLRLTTSWCREKRIALLVQLTAVLGMAGNLLSTAPLHLLLADLGWTPTFLGTAALTAVLGCLIYGTVRDSPVPVPVSTQPSERLRGVVADLAAVWRVPGTRLGFWMHFTSTFSFMAFSLLWGFPFLTRGQGMSPAAASQVLALLVVANMVAGLVFGQLAASSRRTRVPVNAVTIVVVAALWAAVLWWPGPAPYPLVVALVVGLGTCGPASMLGVDVARTANPPEKAATAAATANVGGSIGALVAVGVVGVGLALLDHLAVATATAYTIAFTAQWSLFLVGGTQIVRYWRITRSARPTGRLP